MLSWCWLEPPWSSVAVNHVWRDNPTPGVLQVERRLQAAGFETITFHAVGSGGRAMEEMIEAGLIDGVIDYTISELTDELLGGNISAGPKRLEAAGREGLPQVIVPGAIEVLNFGPRVTVPAHFDTPERRLIVHNENVTAVRTTRAEAETLGRVVAEKVNLARGPLAVMVPLDGFDSYQQRPDGPWIDPEADAGFTRRCAELSIPVFSSLSSPRISMTRHSLMRSRSASARYGREGGGVAMTHPGRAKLSSSARAKKPLIIAGVGCGLTARGASEGGADLLAVYNTAIYRIRNLPSILAFLPGDDPNALTRATAAEVVANAGDRPVLLGFAVR